jgi:hypothetical protein
MEVMMARILRCRMWLEVEDFLLVFVGTSDVNIPNFWPGTHGCKARA